MIEAFPTVTEPPAVALTEVHLEHLERRRMALFADPRTQAIAQQVWTLPSLTIADEDASIKAAQDWVTRAKEIGAEPTPADRQARLADYLTAVRDNDAAVHAAELQALRNVLGDLSETYASSLAAGWLATRHFDRTARHTLSVLTDVQRYEAHPETYVAPRTRVGAAIRALGQFTASIVTTNVYSLANRRANQSVNRNGATDNERKRGQIANIAIAAGGIAAVAYAIRYSVDNAHSHHATAISGDLGPSGAATPHPSPNTAPLPSAPGSSVPNARGVVPTPHSPNNPPAVPTRHIVKSGETLSGIAEAQLAKLTAGSGSRHPIDDALIRDYYLTVGRMNHIDPNHIYPHQALDLRAANAHVASLLQAHTPVNDGQTAHQQAQAIFDRLPKTSPVGIHAIVDPGESLTHFIGQDMGIHDPRAQQALAQAFHDAPAAHTLLTTDHTMYDYGHELRLGHAGAVSPRFQATLNQAYLYVLRERREQIMRLLEQQAA